MNKYTMNNAQGRQMNIKNNETYEDLLIENSS